MRRMLAVILLAGLVVGGVHIARAEDKPTAPVMPITILAPTAGQVVNNHGPIEVMWTRTPDVLFYRVQVFLPAGSQYEFIEHRYVPDTARDIRAHHPRMLVEAGLLKMNANHTVVVTAYGLSDKLMAQYGKPDPLTGVWPYYPTHLSLDWYSLIGQSNSVTFFVDP